MEGNKSSIVKSKSESKNCPICNKVFANGKAFGGHFKAHLSKHPLPAPNPQNRAQNLSDPVPARAPTPVLQPRAGTNGSRILRVRNRGFAFDTESSLKHVTRKRSERVFTRSKPPSAVTAAATSAFGGSPAVAQPVSPAPDCACLEILAANYGAECLMMMSRDTWPRQRAPKEKGNDLSFVGRAGAKSCEERFGSSSKTTGRLSGYPCTLCCKVFRTGQALGGHMKVHVSSSKKSVIKKVSYPNDLSDVSGLTDSEDEDN